MINTYKIFYEAALQAIKDTGDAYKNLSWFRKNKPELTEMGKLMKALNRDKKKRLTNLTMTLGEDPKDVETVARELRLAIEADERGELKVW